MTAGNPLRLGVFRATEIGDLPVDWDVQTLGAAARVYSGGTPSRANPNYWGPPIPWVTTTEVDFGEIRSTNEQITQAGLANSAAKIAPAGTLLIAMYGQGKTRGKTAILGIDAAMNQACAAIEAGKSLSPRYLFHYLISSYDQIRALSNSGSQENLSGEIGKRIIVPVPSGPEQVRIEQVLDNAGDQIATLGRLIAKKQAIKQGMMQQLLTGRTRLPGFTGEWVDRALWELAIVDPENLPAGTNPSEVINYVSLEDVNRGELLGSSQLTFKNAPSRARRVIREMDVLFGTVRPNLQSHLIYAGGLARPVASTGFAVIRAIAGRADPRFLFYLVMSHVAVIQIDRIIAGSNYPAVSSGDVRNLRFEVPDLPEQLAIGAALAESDANSRRCADDLPKLRPSSKE